MDKNLVLNTSFDELVFENRHKDYGAYQIRRRYSKNVMLSGIISSAAMLCFFAAALITQPDAYAGEPRKVNDQQKVVDVNMLQEQKQEQKKEDKVAATPPAKGHAPDTEPQVEPDPKPVVHNDTIGSPTGVTGGSGVKPADTTSVGCTDCLPKDTTKTIETVVIATDPPDFPGIDPFFSSNIRYPQQAKEMGIHGTVWLSWVVNWKGEVENVEVVKGCHPLLDREALRVAKLMPKWIPGKNEGRPVNFIYRKPIRFELR